MTAEIGVMNRIGVALAADSAVTVGAGGSKKTYASADKLFHLSPTAPVGAMFYGNAALVQTPWETVIKTYRRRLGGKTFDKIESYAVDLIKFLGQRHGMFSPKVQLNEAGRLVFFGYLDIRERVFGRLRDKEKSSGKTPQENEIRQVTAEIIRGALSHRRKQGLIKGLPKKTREILRKKLRSTIASLKREIFRDLPMTSGASRNLSSFAVESLVRCVFGPFGTGIVVAGFGEKEYTPGLIEIQIDGLIEGKPRYCLKNKSRVDDDTGSVISPFAQKEMVYTFMEGIEPNLNEMIHATTRGLFYGVVNDIMAEVKAHSKAFGANLAKKVKAATKKLIAELFEEWAKQRKSSHWGPITQTVSSLPKDELAAMAEALVNLTKFRRRVSTDEETVGGPVDVAVITKGDGFVWVKRKHYFDPSLNPRTMGRYLKEVSR